VLIPTDGRILQTNHGVKGGGPRILWYNATPSTHDHENKDAHRDIVSRTVRRLANHCHAAIIIDSGSPYFVPKSATVSSGAPIRWDNPTATDHTITHVGCLQDGNACAFDSGIVGPSGNFTLSGLAPGQYPYLCRIHPIMYGVVTVTDGEIPSQL
jgi:plastocyanin